MKNDDKVEENKKEESKKTQRNADTNSMRTRNVIRDIYDILHTAGVIQENEMISTIEALLYDSDFSAFGIKVDYAIKGVHVSSEDKNSYIAGERYFNYCCLRHIYMYPEKDDYARVLYFIYLLVKHHFNLYFVQSNNKTGFQNFRDYSDRKGNIMGIICPSFSLIWLLVGSLYYFLLLLCFLF